MASLSAQKETSQQNGWWEQTAEKSQTSRPRKEFDAAEDGGGVPALLVGPLVAAASGTVGTFKLDTEFIILYSGKIW